ncbi:MAG: hypothetical protein HY909_12515 [Deltaproteobacteria bacterium]|nr:hypothetical protein [Deltaproteobacteria bacterium]
MGATDRARTLTALAFALAGCGAPYTLQAPLDPSALRAGDGRVAVRVRSEGARQDLALVPEGSPVEQGMTAPEPWCQTPCTLFLRPGRYGLYSGAPTVLHAVSPLTVTEAPAERVLRAPPRARFEASRNLLVGAVGLTVVGGIFLVFSPLEVAGASPTGPETIATGVALVALGVAGAVYALGLLRALPRGFVTP